MKDHLLGAMACMALLSGVSSPEVHAQTLTGNLNQPVVSPYLNILRGGAPAGVNYYNLVQPQLQFYNAINQLQNQQQFQQQVFLQTNSSGALITGHPVQFNNLSHFFPQTGFVGRGGGIQLGSSMGTTGFATVQQNRGQQQLVQAQQTVGVAPAQSGSRKR